MCNLDIKGYALEKGVKLWQIAEKLGITDATFSIKLRKEFTEEQCSSLCDR